MNPEQTKQEVRDKFQQHCNRCKTPNCGLYNVKSICQEAFYINIIADMKSAINEVIKEIEEYANDNYYRGYKPLAIFKKDAIQIIKDKLK